MTQPNSPYPIITLGTDTDYTGPDGTGFEFSTRVITGPPPPPPRVAFLGSADQSAFTGLRLGAHRTYYGMNENTLRMTANLTADAKAGRWSIVSIGRAGPNDVSLDWPARLDTVAAGKFLPALRLNPGRVVLIPHHEPETSKGTAAAFRNWAAEFIALYRTALPSLRFAPCLMTWTCRATASDLDTWMPPVPVDFLGIDGYAHLSGQSVVTLFANALAYARARGLPLIVCETGQEATADQVAFLDGLDVWMASNPDVAGVCYWNGKGAALHDYRLGTAALARFANMLARPLYGTSAYAPI